MSTSVDERLTLAACALLVGAAIGCNGAAPASPAASTAATTKAATTAPAATAPSSTPPPSGAKLVSVDIPAQMYAGQTAGFYVTLTNTGTATWDDTFRLGVVGDTKGDAARFLEDPILGYARSDRVHLPSGVTVAPGSTYTFAFVGKAPATPGTYDLELQMIQEPPATSFGPLVAQKTVVGAALATGTVPPDAVDLSRATVHNSPPDVAQWPATTAISGLEIEAKGFQLRFDKRDGPGSWPDYVPPGFQGPIEYTLWSVERIDGKWETSGVIQIWRDPGFGLWIGGAPSMLEQNWYYDPGRWGPLAAHQPAVGEPVGFFVTAGNARNVSAPGATSVLERSNVVIVPFPADTGATFTFP